MIFLPEASQVVSEEGAPPFPVSSDFSQQQKIFEEEKIQPAAEEHEIKHL